MPKHILTGPEVLPTLLRGVNRIADPVKATLGPNGRNTVYERQQTNQPVSTRDGVTVANQIDAIDPFENIAVELLKGVAREAVEQAGDGTTTSTLLAQAIFAEGVKACGVGANPVAIKRGIEKATVAVVEGLKAAARPCVGGMLRQVATISANNDEFLGGLIADAMEKAGDDGVVTVEISRSPDSSLDLVDGMQFGTGWLHEAFVTNGERREAVLEDVAVFLYEKKLTTIKPMLPMLTKLRASGKKLLVIAEDVTDEALAILAFNATVGPEHGGAFRCCAVKTPGGTDHLHDIAALVGGRVITDLSGVKLADVKEEDLGHAPRVVVKAGSTTVYSGNRESITLQRRLAELRQQVKDAGNEGERLRVQGRLARLAGGIAVIRVGGKTEPEMLERRDRIDDAIHATRCAAMEGVVVGGGMALIRCSKIPTPSWEEDERAGALIVSKACYAPLRTLAQNSGKSPEYIIAQVSEADTDQFGGWQNYGWNARTDFFCDLIGAGVLDPLRVVRVALESAASVAGLMLITHTLCANERS